MSVYDGNGNAADVGRMFLEEGITGVAVNTTDKFVMSANGKCVPSQLIIASETGRIWGLSPDVSPDGFVLIDRSNVGAIYKGVAVIRDSSGNPLLLAADFHNNRIDVFDGNLNLIRTPSFVLQNPLPGFAPFNVMFLGGTVYITYAEQDADAEDDVPGPGLGIVAAFDVSGNQIWATSGGTLNAPWGMQLAASFGPFTNVLLVGNFGDGRINVVDPVRGGIMGQLDDTDGNPIMIDGLWGLALPDDVVNAVASAVYFAAGPNREADGLFGLVEPAVVTN
jgi:uncharacterized protein (TIGR03118 family)